MLPYSVVGANAVATKNGKRIIAREYPWGIVESKSNKYTELFSLHKHFNH